mgnify:CR=1 FL=1
MKSDTQRAVLAIATGLASTTLAASLAFGQATRDYISIVGSSTSPSWTSRCGSPPRPECGEPPNAREALSFIRA